MTDHLFMNEVTQPVLIKAGDLFLVSRSDGAIPDDGKNGEGLFFHDMRYLSCYALRVGGRPPMPLMSSSISGGRAVLQFSNYDICEDRERILPLQSLGMELRRSLNGAERLLRDDIRIRSFAPEHARFTLTVELDARFEDLFELRGNKPKARGELARTVTADGLRFNYHGEDGIKRALHVTFSPRPSRIIARDSHPAQAVFNIDLASQASTQLTVSFHVQEIAADQQSGGLAGEVFFEGVAFTSNSGQLETVMRRSFADLQLLQTSREHSYIAGGIPWFVAPFARDSIIAALQVMPYDPRPAAGVARQLAAHQGRRCDVETREEPGKIPHELRVGEMARLKEIQHYPSYFSIDATPLFLALIGQHVAWTGCVSLFLELRSSVERALAWLDECGDTDGDGFIDYHGVANDGPINQGWKDSPGAVVHVDGRPAAPPVALCEVQGYVYLAKKLLAEVYRQADENAVADRLASEAQQLAQRFNRDFWMADEDCYCLALAKGREPIRTIASNAGHALWSGIAEPDKARRTAERLLRSDMSSGWGVRTLSEDAKAYNPVHYHLGSVWPFDNALLVQGLIRYGLRDKAGKVFGDVLDAAACFSLGRLPEFYVGFQREPDLLPARCPFAEPLQAWSSGAIPAMTATFLGLRRLTNGTLEVDRPSLPPGASRIALTIRSPDGDPIACEFERTGAASVSVRARGPAGDLRVVDFADGTAEPQATDWPGAA
jgi:glycogen debranching enzyme